MAKYSEYESSGYSASATSYWTAQINASPATPAEKTAMLGTLSSSMGSVDAQASGYLGGSVKNTVKDAMIPSMSFMPIKYQIDWPGKPPIGDPFLIVVPPPVGLPTDDIRQLLSSYSINLPGVSGLFSIQVFLGAYFLQPESDFNDLLTNFTSGLDALDQFNLANFKALIPGAIDRALKCLGFEKPVVTQLPFDIKTMGFLQVTVELNLSIPAINAPC